MTTPSVLVLRAAGTNCEAETAYAFEAFGARTTTLHVNQLLKRPDLLSEHHVLAFPGGFAYGDDVAAGAVWACEMRSRLGEPIETFVRDGGLVLGICNGFQALVRLGLLPGLSATLGVQEMSLTDNISHKYEDRWVDIVVSSHRCVFASEGNTLTVPVAHAEGRLVCRDDDVIRQLVEQDRVVFRYADANGLPTQDYPLNPNGSVDAIAGLTDKTGRVLGLMPHPERALFGFHRPDWTRRSHAGLPPEDFGPGAGIFRSACDWIRKER